MIRAGEYYDCTIFLHLISHRRIDMEITARTDLIVRVWDSVSWSRQSFERKKKHKERKIKDQSMDGLLSFLPFLVFLPCLTTLFLSFHFSLSLSHLPLIFLFFLTLSNREIRATYGVYPGDE